MKQYCDWFGVKEKSEFFRDVRIKEAYKRYVRYVAERYKDDESVFAFQLINEPRMESGGGENGMVRDAIMSEWCQEMIQAFREVNMNHMLSLVRRGFILLLLLSPTRRTSIRFRMPETGASILSNTLSDLIF